jgi:hypothetical protein
MNVAPPKRPAQTSDPTPLYEYATSALAADFEVEADAALVVLAAPVPVVVAAAEVADAGREERTASALYVAVRPVALVQEDGTVVAVPETKLTAAHYWVLESSLVVKEEEGLFTWYRSPSGASCTTLITPLDPAHDEGTTTFFSQNEPSESWRMLGRREVQLPEAV